MLPLPHPAFPRAIFPAVVQTQASALLAVQFQLSQTERLPPEAMRERQFRQIAELVAHIDRCVPFYGTTLRKAGVKPGQPITAEAWSRVPLLTREQVQQAGDRLHAREIPPGHGRVGSATTSGSSGRPITIRKTDLSQFYWQCFSLREEIWHQRDLSATSMGIRRDDLLKPHEPTGQLRRLPDWGAPLSTVYPTGPALLLDYRCPVSEQAETILRERPTYLTTFPSLLHELLRTGVCPSGLREVRTVGEAVSEDTRSLCAERWGARVTDMYSAAEIGLIACECPEHGRYHVQAESTLVEVLRSDGTACEVGETGRVVLTPLHNFAMPLVRYVIDDMAEIGEPCPCGRALPVLARIPGRARGLLVLPSGERRFPFYGHGQLMRVDAIVQHQVVQRSLALIEVRLVVRRALTADEESYIRRVVSDALGEAFEVRVSYCDPIARGPGGKYAEFHSEVS